MVSDGMVSDQASFSSRFPSTNRSTTSPSRSPSRRTSQSHSYGSYGAMASYGVMTNRPMSHTSSMDRERDRRRVIIYSQPTSRGVSRPPSGATRTAYQPTLSTHPPIFSAHPINPPTFSTHPINALSQTSLPPCLTPLFLLLLLSAGSIAAQSLLSSLESLSSKLSQARSHRSRNR